MVALEDAKRLHDTLHQVKQSGRCQNDILVDLAQHRTQLDHGALGAQHKHGTKRVGVLFVFLHFVENVGCNSSLLVDLGDARN